MKHKIGLIATSIILCIGMLTACGSGIDDAKSLSDASKKAQESVESFHLDSEVDMDMTFHFSGPGIDASNSKVEMPVEISMDIDSGKETAHGNTNVKMSMMGQSMDQDSEVYLDLVDKVVYTKAAGSDTWAKTSSESNMTDVVNCADALSDSVLEKAEFQEDDDEYVLTVAAKDMGDAINDLGFTNDMNTNGLEVQDLNITNGTVTYKFFKDTQLLKSMEMDDVTIDASGVVQGQHVNITIGMDADYDFSKYNEVDASAYEIPAEVTGESTETTEETTTEEESSTETTETTAAQETTDLPKATTQLTVDAGSYVVGQDSIPAGTYNVFHGDGEGTLSVNGSEWNVGGDSDNLTDGTQITVKDGDSVSVSDGLAIVFDPVN